MGHQCSPAPILAPLPPLWPWWPSEEFFCVPSQAHAGPRGLAISLALPSAWTPLTWILWWLSSSLSSFMSPLKSHLFIEMSLITPSNNSPVTFFLLARLIFLERHLAHHGHLTHICWNIDLILLEHQLFAGIHTYINSFTTHKVTEEVRAQWHKWLRLRGHAWALAMPILKVEFEPLLFAPGCPCTALHLSKEEGELKQIHLLPHAEGDCVGYIYKIIFIFTNTLRSKHYLYFRDEKTEPSERLNIQLKITTSSYWQNMPWLS